jgi:hypothetical protein
MINNDTKIVETASEYSLKYDEKSEGLRDRTFSELIKDYGPNIICPCMNRNYQITSQFVKSHFNSQKHKNWVIKSQKEHIEIYGHCCAPQDIVNIQNKDLRNLKCNICDLTNKNKTLAQENLKLKESNKSFQDEIALLKTKIIELEDVDEYEKFTDCN